MKHQVKQHSRAVRLAALVVAGSVAFALAGCTGQTLQDDSTVTVGIPTSPTSLDPNVASSSDDAFIIRQVFDSLVSEDENHEFQPWLAESWDISDDGLTYTFHLKDGVKFHDGTDFDAEAVKFNIDRILDPETKSRYAAALLGPTTGATVVDDLTVELNLETPYIPLLEGLSQAFLGMNSPTAIEKYGTDIHPVGTGPFVFEKYVTDQEVDLSANEDYSSAPATAAHQGAPLIDSLTFKIVPETSARVGALSSGELTAAKNVPAEQLNQLKEDSSLSVSVVQVPGATYAWYINTLNAPWDDPDARRALRMGMDIDTALQTLYFGNYPRAWSVLSPATDGYDASLENSWEYDPEGAVAEFEKLGYTMGDDGFLQKDGQALSLRIINQSPNNDKRLDFDEIIQQQLKEVGIQLDTAALEFPQYAAATQAGEYDIEPFSITSGSPSVMFTIFNSANQPNADQFLYNVAHYTAPEMDEWGHAAAAAPDADTANEYYTDMQRQVIDEAVAIPIYVQVVSLASSANLKGLAFDPRAYALFYDVSF